MLRAFLASRILHAAIAIMPLAGAALSQPSSPPTEMRRSAEPRVIDTLANIPSPWRRENWVSSSGSGSCVHAAMVHLLHWQGQHRVAEAWQAQHSGGQNFDDLAQQFDSAQIRWAGTANGDEAFLAWAVRTRRGAGVAIQVPSICSTCGRDHGYAGNHMVTLVGMDERHVFVLDSNSPQNITARDRAEFMANWHRGINGGWAISPVYDPPPPRPHL